MASTSGKEGEEGREGRREEESHRRRGGCRRRRGDSVVRCGGDKGRWREQRG